ncbi:flagellar motor protein MotB [Paenibacillus mucilaginosus]|uniref:OmpA-like domain-containing protein n=3 Tax=Paenibacillus mucilaginosus TaxID=61624 RepID=H6N8Z2_9BACL|nr:flagellar motor protein MotB [Paenibacillus mucilaginosus]AEI39480.1 hypothetical protein KNP414_00890 [Paenibacillus mucilaginosus KNP414]AFC27738.1 hypothetical protein PM3016_784 [Paenibacillus mucilaginosus 3016]AFH59893.1 flagellar motor protein MotB [Paenibacillus mucilaginosus K02]MCG7214693.1 flagellar motor protein MotB [Paenibacillus mucilaginosus]WDM28447.1 flagellar motor protein MotB [Paenibacillus mucilaginosus]
MSKHHKKHHHEEHVDESWLIPYADLLTLLLALFIILFASSQTDSKKYNAIMQSLNAAFTSGTGFFEMSNVVPMTDPNPGAKKNDGADGQQQNPETPQTPAEQKTEEEKQKALEVAFQEEKRQLEELKQKLDDYIQNNNLSTQLETKLTNDMLMITIRDNALFASGSATVKPEAQALAVSMSNMLAQYPGYNIEVAGHTDNVPISRRDFESNWDLSGVRAMNFMKILLRNTALSPEKFRTIGYGEFQPVDTNDTPEGRAKNRRVEVSIIRNLKPAQSAQVQ